MDDSPVAEKQGYCLGNFPALYTNQVVITRSSPEAQKINLVQVQK
jgi:hypothetical protein